MKCFTKGRLVRPPALPGRIARRVAALALAVVFTGACSDSTGPQDLDTLTVSPTSETVAVTQTVQLSAAGTRVGSSVTIIEGETWSVSGGGTISENGLFTAGTTPGVSTVTVTCGGLTSTAIITVTAGPLATITVTPDPATLEINATQQFVAVGRDAQGNVVEITPTWSVTTGGAINSSTGLYTAGTTTGTFENSVTATSGSISGDATVIVTPGPLATITVTPNPDTLGIGATQMFTAVGRDASGNVVAITPTWSVVNGGGTIDANTGIFTAGSTSGSFAGTVVATQGSVSGTATVVVTPGPLATITVTPNPETLGIGETQQFTAVGRDAAGNVVAITATWSVVNGGGTIDAGTGLFTAGNTTGTFAGTVQATQGSVSGVATVNVTAGALTTITVTPNPETLGIGETQQFTAVGRDAGGNVVSITPTWSVVNGGGTIDASSGLFTAGNTTGTFTNTVRATEGTVSGSATVNVTAGALTTITVTPNPDTLQAGTQQQFTAVGRDAGGNVVSITPTWSVVNGGGTIDAGSGLFTAGGTAGTFNNTVRATDGTVSGEATVTVTSVPPPTPSSTFTVLANAAVSCTDGSIDGDVGTDQASPTGSITLSSCPITNGTPQVGTTASMAAYDSFVASHTSLATAACDVVLTGTLAGVTLAPGVYCFDAAASLTGTLTLDGPSTGKWLFKVGTSGVGALTGTNFDVVMAGTAQACNVTWRVQNGATMTDSNLKGNILSGAGVTLTRGTLIGNAWGQGDVTITGTAVTGC